MFNRRALVSASCHMCLFPEAWHVYRLCICRLVNVPLESISCIYQASRSRIAAIGSRCSGVAGDRVSLGRSTDATSSRVLAAIRFPPPHCSPPLASTVIPDPRPVVYEMACLLSTSRENIIDVARRKARGESPRFKRS